MRQEMKTNKITALVLVALAAGQYSGFASAAASQQLTVWEDIKKSDGIKQAISDFEKQNNVKITVQEMPFAQQLEKLRLDGPAGIGPDILVIPNDQLGSAVVQGLLAPLKVDKQFLAGFTKPSVDAFQLNGNTYAVPKAVETLVLIYNKALLPKPPTTLADFYTFSKQERAKGLYGLLVKFDEVYYDYGVITGMGGYIFGHDAAGKINVADIGLNNPGSIDAITYIKKFYAEGLFPSGIIGENGL